MKYIAGLVFTIVAGIFCYLMATVPNDDIALGFGVGVLITLALLASATWLGSSIRK